MLTKKLDRDSRPQSKQWRIKAPEISFGLICNSLICCMYYNRGDHILCFYSSHYLHLLFHFLHGLKQELKTLDCCWCMGLHSSVGRALQQFCRGFWRMMARFRGMRLREMLLKYLFLREDYFLEFHQPLHAVIDLTLRWRILVTMFRISRLCPSVVFILKVWKSLSLHLMWGHFEKSRTITQQIGINFPEKDYLFSPSSKSRAHPITTWSSLRVHA